MRDEIETLKALIAHWREDAAAGLPCTEGSLGDAERAIERMEIQMPPAGRSVALTEAGKSHGDRNPVETALVTAGETAPDAMSEILDDCRAYFDNRSDVSDGDYGIPEANEEMRMVTRIDAVLSRSASLKERAA